MLPELIIQQRAICTIMVAAVTNAGIGEAQQIVAFTEQGGKPLEYSK